MKTLLNFLIYNVYFLLTIYKNRYDKLYLYRLETIGIVCFKQIKIV